MYESLFFECSFCSCGCGRSLVFSDKFTILAIHVVPWFQSPRRGKGVLLAHSSLELALFSCSTIGIMKQKFTAVYTKKGKWYVGWIEEIAGVNTQGRTMKEVRENLRDALQLILETNRFMNARLPQKSLVRESLTISLP